MGDRCCISVTVRTEHLEAFGNATGWAYWIADDPVDGEQSVQVNVDEVNYGGDDDLEEAAKLGLPFYGYHGAGDCYGAMLFACDGKKVMRLCCDVDGFPTVRCDPDTGAADKGDLHYVKRFVKFNKAVRAVVDRKELPNGDSV